MKNPGYHAADCVPAAASPQLVSRRGVVTGVAAAYGVFATSALAAPAPVLVTSFTACVETRGNAETFRDLKLRGGACRAGEMAVAWPAGIRGLQVLPGLQAPKGRRVCRAAKGSRVWPAPLGRPAPAGWQAPRGPRAQPVRPAQPVPRARRVRRGFRALKAVPGRRARPVHRAQPARKGRKAQGDSRLAGAGGSPGAGRTAGRSGLDRRHGCDRDAGRAWRARGTGNPGDSRDRRPDRPAGAAWPGRWRHDLAVHRNGSTPGPGSLVGTVVTATASCATGVVVGGGAVIDSTARRPAACRDHRDTARRPGVARHGRRDAAARAAVHAQGDGDLPDMSLRNSHRTRSPPFLAREATCSMAKALRC